MENTQPLDAGLRTEVGKGPNRRLRAAGMIPAVVYGRTLDPIHLKVDPAALKTLLDGEYGMNAIFRLNIEGDDAAPVVRVLEIQRDPVKRFLKHADFHAVNGDQPITVQLPLHLEGIPVGVKNGGKVRQIRHSVKGIMKPADLPTHLTLNISRLKIGEMARVSDIDLPDGVSLIYSDNFAVVSVNAMRGAALIEDEEEAEEGEE